MNERVKQNSGDGVRSNAKRNYLIEFMYDASVSVCLCFYSFSQLKRMDE